MKCSTKRCSPKRCSRVIKLNQKAWLNPYIDMDTKLRQKAKNNVEKDILQ